MTLQPRHFGLAVVLHAILFAFLLVSVQCSEHIETSQPVVGVIITPNDLKALRAPTPPAPKPPKPDEQDEGPQKIVSNTDVVADKAKEEREKAAAEQQLKQQEQKLEQQRQKEAQAKAEELKQQELAKVEADRAAAQKKQQDDARKKAEAEAATQQQQKKELDEQIRKEAEEQQKAQAAALARQKKAEDAQREADRRQRAEELKKQLGVESAQLTQQVQNEWITQLSAAIRQAWNWPSGSNPSTKATLRIRLSATGAVQEADISKGSGVPLFDQTLVQAARQASPLPLPRDPSAFDPVLNICFSPNPRSCEQQ